MTPSAPQPEDKAFPLKQCIALGLLLLVLFTFNIWNYDLWHADENRFAQVSREMMRSGDYLAPHLNGQPYREKPPLLFWGIVLVSTPFGDVTGESARVVLALAALAAVAFTFLLARNMFNTRTAFLATLILATSWRFFWQARTVQIDMLLTACTTASLLMLWYWHRYRNPKHLMLLYFAVGAGMLAKGPPAIIFPLLTILFFYRGKKEDRRATHWLIGFLASIAMLLAWLIPARMSVSSPEKASVQQGILENAYRQTLGRIFEGVGHANPPWYYLKTIPVDLLPWSLLLPFALFFAWKQRNRCDATKMLFAWILPALIFFSLTTGKRSVYLLPILPTLAILIAVYTTQKLEKMKALRGTLPRTIKSIPFLLFTVYLLLVFFYFPIHNQRKSVRTFCAPLYTLTQQDQHYELYMLGYSRPGYVFYTDHFHTALFNPWMTYGPEKKLVFNDLRGIVKNSSLSMAAPIQTETFNTFAQDIHTFIQHLDDTTDGTQHDQLNQHIAALLELQSSPNPAFIIVQEKDFIWLSALEPTILDFFTLQYGQVGSRTLILLGNTAAQSLDINPLDDYRPYAQHVTLNDDPAPITTEQGVHEE